MKRAIPTSCVARPGSEKPVVYVGTQIANTISERMSERTVAPIVTMTGSRRSGPEPRDNLETEQSVGCEE